MSEVLCYTRALRLQTEMLLQTEEKFNYVSRKIHQFYRFADVV